MPSPGSAPRSAAPPRNGPARTYAAQRAALRQVLTRLEQDGHIGSDHELPEPFTDIRELLAAAQLRWHSHLGARIDAALETGPHSGETPAAAVGSAYREAAHAMPQLRRLLDLHAGHPALEEADQRELSLLAWAAGISPSRTSSPHAARRGREFRDAIRNRTSATHAVTDRDRIDARQDCVATVWLRRLKNGIAA